MRVVITGGGTGGHISPGLAIAEALRALDADLDILFVGGRGLESRLVPAAGWPFTPVAARSVPRRPTIRGLWALTVLGVGGIQALMLLRRSHPDVVVATGGYAAAPVGAAAGLLRIPLILQEQNLHPGVTNRLLGRWARAVSVPHESASAAFPGKALVTGVPIRTSALTGDRATARARFGLAAERFTLLVLGGSQGAHSLNRAVVDMLSLLPTTMRIQVLHQTGPAHISAVRERLAQLEASGRSAVPYVVSPYFDPIGDAYAAADIVLSRAGAATLAEITANGRPAMLVPYPYAAEGHQAPNAAVLEGAGAAVVVADRELDGRRLATLIAELIGNPARLVAMATASRTLGRPQAARSVAELVVQTAAAHQVEVARERAH